MSIISKWEIVPEIEFINSFCDHPDFIQAFAELGNKHNPSNYDHVLMSFHGLPERQIKKGDNFDHCLNDGCCDTLNDKNAFCYRAQCHQTARKMAEAMNIPKEKYTICFQSRLGKDPWIKPYSDMIIKERAAKGDKNYSSLPLPLLVIALKQFTKSAWSMVICSRNMAVKKYSSLKV